MCSHDGDDYMEGEVLQPLDRIGQARLKVCQSLSLVM